MSWAASIARADPPCPDLVISEFMARNAHGIKDSNGTYQDWIEIHNPCQPSVNLDGWYLTDEASNLTKWRFPAVSLGRGEFLVVFASGKNRAVAGAELHTNFELDAGGEYLALVRPDGTTIQQQFAPKYPEQTIDVSYGSPQSVSPLVAPDATGRYHVPTAADAGLGTSWSSHSFDDASWTSAQFGLGFLSTSSSQFDVTYYKANINVNTITDAEAVIADPLKQTTVVHAQAAYINYLNTGGTAHFAADLPFPSTTIGSDVDDFVILATGTVVIPTAGNWTFGVNSDDGFALQLTHGTDVFTTSYPNPRGPADTLAVFNIPAAGPYQLRLSFYERGGGSGLELFAAAGSQSGFNSNFHLVGDVPNGGLSVVGFGGDVHTDVQPAMLNINASLWTRVGFTAANPGSLSALILKMRYEDGYVAYINGQEVARQNAPAAVEWNSTANVDRPINNAFNYETIDLTSYISTLQTGANTLAIHGLNDAASNGDFLVLPTLTGSEGTIDPSIRRFFTTPTPGGYNNAGYPDFAGKVQYSVASGTFSTNFPLSITTNSPTASIRYTLDGSAPTATTGTAYSGPITITGTTQIRARAFESGLAPGPVLSRDFIKLDSTTLAFSSNLPVVIVENFNGGTPGTEDNQPAHLTLFEPTAAAGNRTVLTGTPSIETRCGIRRRGSSTADQPKPNLAVETWDEDNEDRDIIPLGMPPESDWILYAPYYYDRALLRNAFIYQLSNQIGRYAVRTRFVEVFFDNNGGGLTTSDDYGVYVLMEKIKLGPDRVNIDKIEVHDDAEPEITGGWINKIDRADPGDLGFSAAGQAIRYVEPKEEEVTPVQAAWIQNYFNAFGNALNGAGFTDPVNGYAKYIDVDAWIDHHILNVLTMNVDALRLSAYMFKPREGKIEFGPIWDFDRAMDSYDGRDDVPTAWNGTGDATPFFTYPWWNRLFQDPDFWQKWIDRWFELRRAPLTTTNMNAILNGMAAQLQEAQVRNFAKWPAVAPAVSYPTEITNIENWLAARVAWIDQQFPAPPQLSLASGQVTFGAQLAITSAVGAIYYTTDGTDPRLPGGLISGSAQAYLGPLTLNTDTHIRVRVLNGPNWSAPAEGLYVLSFAANPQIVINEIMYNPAGAGANEFIELRNLSATEAVDLSGWTLDGVGLTFATGTVIPPGAYAVVVEDLPTFQSTHGTSILVLADYTGQLDNGGEPLVLYDQHGIEKDRVVYDDVAPWPLSPDGTGPSLELIDATRDNNRVANWAASVPSGGTPGAANSRAGTSVDLPNLVINEVLPSNATSNADEHGDHDPWIELYNPTQATITLDGLYLTNNYGSPALWQFPAGTSLCGGHWMLVWADNEPGEGPLHAGFTLSPAGGAVAIYSSGGLVIDYVNYAASASDVAFGRYPDGTTAEHVLPHPTPGFANATGTSQLILNEYNGVASNKFLKNNATDTYWGRVVGNGGDWFELVVTQDHLDIRNWTLVITDNTGAPAQETDTMVFTNAALWSDLRRGTIITVSEDLADDVSYNPAGGDWWINVRAANAGTGTYITASNFPVSNDNWQLTIKNALGAVVFGPAGEGVSPTSGIGNDEICKLEEDPSPFITPHSNYQDGSSSSFGSPNIFNGGTLTQDFTALRNVFEACTQPADCDDGNQCTLDSCVAGHCGHAAGSPCYELRLNSPGANGPQIETCGAAALTLTIDLTGVIEPVNAVQALLAYDPTRLQLLSITPGDGAGSPWDAATPITFEDNNGAVTFAQVLLGGSASTSATMATMHFTVLPMVGPQPPTRVTISPGCLPYTTRLTTATSVVIVPTLFDSNPIALVPCLSVDVSIPGLIGMVAPGAPVATRDVEFTLTACSGPPDVRTIPLTFNRSGPDGVAAVVLGAVNPSATWLAVREGHTLLRRVPISLTSATPTAAVSLVSGDFHTAGSPQDGLIDIVDFAILASRWNSLVSDCPTGAPADCARGADATGDGVQGTADFTAVQLNFGAFSDPPDGCPPPVFVASGDRPAGGGVLTGVSKLARTSIRSADIAVGARSAASADLNGDGLIDAADVRIFAQRNRITLRPEFARKLGLVASPAATSVRPSAVTHD